jgi:UDP-glucuronate decarboxylase
MPKQISFLNDDIKNSIYELKLILFQLKDKKILVTGASGHLGYCLLLIFLQGNRDFNLNLKITAISRGKLNQIFLDYKNEFLSLKGDLTDHNFINNLEDYDLIFHLAGYAQPTKFISDPKSTILINTEAVSLLLNKVNLNGRFLFISSSEVYTNSNIGKNNEKSIGLITPDHPRSPYILSKLLGEALCSQELANSNKKISIARLSMTYGPGINVNDSRAVSSFIYQALTNKSIALIDQGTAKREYIYVMDAIVALIKISIQGEGYIYNIGAGNEGSITILETAKVIAKLTGSEVILPEHNFNLLSARNNVELDIDKYTTEFGSPYKITFNQGIDKTIKWFKEEYNF